MGHFDDFGPKLGKCLDLLAVDALVVIVLPIEPAKLLTLLRVKVREQNLARLVLFELIRWSVSIILGFTCPGVGLVGS
jgi:hypothetical protein